MCGIVALVSAGGRASLETAVKSLVHRGPDGAGVWMSPDGRVGLGHRRLAVIETAELGAQPMSFAQGDLVISFNGEIYNYLELGDELDRMGVVRRSCSDTEVILAAWHTWGPHCLSRLDGMFAFALYDSSSKKLFFARDRAGEKPLFYKHDRNGCVLASELKAILSLEKSKPRLKISALENFLAWGYTEGSDCLLEGYSKLPPATLATLDLKTNALSFECYWKTPLPLRSDLTDIEILQELDIVLAAAVKRQLVSDVPVGVLLSGGLDSSLVAAYAADALSTKLKTFNVSFPGNPHLDESAHATKVASFLGSDHIEIALPEISSDLLKRLIEQVDEPIADPSLLPTAALANAVRGHVTVALGGDGGDELFGGYPQYCLLARLETLRRRIPAAVKAPGRSFAKRLPQHLIGYNAVRSLFDANESIGRFNVLFGAGLRHALLPDHFSMCDMVEIKRDSLAPTGLAAAERAARADFASYLPDQVLVKVDRASMLYSLEVRAPFLDRQVLDYVFSRVPWRLKSNRNARKIALRKLAERRLPRGFDVKRKQGFTPPIGTWLGTTLRPMIEETVEHLAGCGFDRRTLIALAARPDRHANRVFALIVLSEWMRVYGVQI